MVDATASLDAATQQILALLAQIRLGNIRAVQAQDIGAADAYVVAPVPAVASIGPDLLLVVDIANPNATTNPKLIIQGLPQVPILAADGSPPAIGSVAGKRLIGFSSVVGGGFVARLIGLAPADIAAVALSIVNTHARWSFGLIVAGSGTVQVPANVTFLDVEVIGAGGAGGSTGSASFTGGAGGGGGRARKRVPVTPGEILTYTVGAGGLGTGGSGNTGGTTTLTGSFGTISATGGTGGQGNGAVTMQGGFSGIGYGGDINDGLGDGDCGNTWSGSPNPICSGKGGGPGGQTGTGGNGPGFAGRGPGGGGGGNAQGSSGGNGAPGGLYLKSE